MLASVAASVAQVAFPSKKNRLVQCLIDRNLYRDRKKVERFFSRLKQFRRLVTRYDKTASSLIRHGAFRLSPAMVRQLSVQPMYYYIDSCFITYDVHPFNVNQQTKISFSAGYLIIAHIF